ncbi:outer membrane protein with beta-barrel domain [Winogradskyella wandonensis]|uniref:Outer membrane protein with beta-barrel domain n=1 Tax=Winogradskyella wandonensis TaxID=1442586 RepID=A0A4V2PTI2_9FLAO|nr:porin family protein [Winogradskyella wandonensis]TCK66611.1 outer membrane protein with beta-barrel domain [Winogradskyella wandonensis]
MKNLFLTALCIAGFSTALFAQSGSGFGIKAGLNYAGNGDYFESASSNAQNPDKNIGYHIGLFGKLGNKLYFRPELVYTKIKSDYDSGEFDMQKLDLPLLVGLKVLGPVNVFAGPAFQYVLDTDSGFTNLGIDELENDFSVGLNFGIGINLNRIGIDLRYERGFSDNEATFIDNNNIITTDRLDTRPEQLILSLSYKI